MAIPVIAEPGCPVLPGAVALAQACRPPPPTPHRAVTLPLVFLLLSKRPVLLATDAAFFWPRTHKT